MQKPTENNADFYFNQNENSSPEPKNFNFANDYFLRENLADFVREKIPERVVNAAGAGAFGTFTATADLQKYSRAKLFSKGNVTDIFVRFSSLIAENDSARDVRGFAIKFFTEDGNWDLTGQNFPVFFLNDPSKYTSLIRTMKKNPATNLDDRAAAWDFFSKNPETLHQVLMLFSERGIPQNFRQLDGFGAHTFSFVNENNERFWVKFHLKTSQGIKNKNGAETSISSQEDLVKAIENGDFPKWKFYIQIMSEDEARELKWNPFDATKVWFHDDFPLMEIGEIELNRLPENYFEEVEKAAFSPANLVDGIGLSPDQILQFRLHSYRDAQRYRLGNQSNNFNKENLFKTKNHSLIESFHEEHFSLPEYENDHYTQSGLFYTKALNDGGREALVKNIVDDMKEIKTENRNDIINRQLCHFFRANVEMGIKIAMALQINIDANMMSHAK